ncbi:hypothetical protein BDV27DRAFT_120237 [Aspergillus caelatus]|uniref:Zinc finger GRF-type domain-containing protein n=1 Tax=Aspergillus caelatus TaxID=61420 RepID=A0A5N7AIV7_9EURO|nr:uncharacterized protein BDV27DRAFT_120237 [Aspergillus caelatus]KAE8369824.1 hypothetical protein BDV27DRAFT_120237 [Aspergillus caelatus]
MSHLRSTYTGVTIDAEKTLLCRCGYAMRRYTVKDMGSPYRGEQYLACRRHSKDKEHCKSLIWFNEASQVEGLVPRLAVPQTPKKQTDIREFLTPPKSSSLKRKRVNMDPGSLDELPGDDIEDSDLSEETLDSPSRSRQRLLRGDDSTPVARSLFVQEGINTARRRPLRRFGTPPHRLVETSTPRNLEIISSGLLTPGSGGRGYRKRWLGMEAPATPTKQNHIFASPACVVDDDVSDSDSYGWDEELVAAMLDSSDQVEPLA